MEVSEALQYLNQQLDLACQSRPSGIMGDAMPHSRLEEMGESFSNSQVGVSRDPSIKSFHASRCEPIHGQSVYIRFLGKVQPEAARVLDHILTPILNKLEISSDTIHRRFPGDSSAERCIAFDVPEERAGDFAFQVGDLAHQIRNNPDLKNQVRNGIELSVDYINLIENGRVKPHLMFVPRQVSFNNDQPEANPSYFNLLMENVPVSLARELAEVSGKDFDALPTSNRSYDRTGRKEFGGGGKDFLIAMNDSKIGAVVDKIRDYIRLQKKFGRDDNSSPAID